MASLEGQTLGQYQVIAQMGSGGMATVYKAYQPRLDRYVAIKMLHEAFQEDPNFLARFEREAKIVARLEHPHIVQVFDYDEYNGRPYLVMKYVEGRTLKAELDDMPPTTDEILRLMLPIADALDYAHRQGVLHRDIKPSNIIIDASGVPYLTDFGLARMALLGDSTLSQDVLLGTPHYISPEQAMGNRDIDSRTDLYSLGVVLYQLVVGRVPFSADTPFAIIHDQIYRELPLPSSINPRITPAVDAVLVKALAKLPADRYATATEMIEAFRRAFEHGEMPVSQATNPEAPSRVEPIAAAPGVPAPLPPRPPSDEDNERSRASWPGRGFEPPGGLHQMRHESRKARREAKREARRVVEREFDFSDAGRALSSAGQAVRDVIEGFSSSWDRNVDPDLVPMDNEEAIRRRVEFQFNKRKEFFGHIIAYVLVNALLWIIYGSSVLPNLVGGDVGAMLGFPWPLVVMLAWGSGLAAHAIEIFYVTGRRAARRLQTIQGEFYRVYGEDWPRADRKELRRIRDRVTQLINKRREFVQHLAVYTCINLMLWVIFGMSGGLSFMSDVNEAIAFPWPLIVMFGWGIGLVINAFEAFTAVSRENSIRRAVEREREALYASEKPKREQRSESQARVRLTEDGEFTDSMIEEMNDEEKPKRDRR